MKYFLFSILGLGVGAVAALLFLFVTNAEFEPVPFRLPDITREESDEPVIPARTAPEDLVRASFEHALDWEVGDQARVLLLPHHLVAGREIASLLSSTPVPKRVYLLMPDHFSRGRTSFTITDASFDTFAGEARGDVKRVRELSASVNGMRSDRDAVAQERAVSDLMPFFKTAWSKARVIPIIVRLPSSDEERRALSMELIDRLKREHDSILVATVDFSHYLPVEAADFHDVLARDVIEGLGAESTFNVECDNPDALSIALTVARNMLLGDVTIHAHTNSLTLAQSTLATESTSHFTVSFSEGLVWNEDEATILFLGDMMFDRDVRRRMAASDEEFFPFQNIAGAEGRFFRGQDFVVGNLEGPVTAEKLGPEKENDFAFDPSVAALLSRVGITSVSQANNHALDQGRVGAEESARILKEHNVAPVGDQVHDDANSSLVRLSSRGGHANVSLLAFNVTDNALDKETAAQAIREANASNPYTVVYVHWGNEYQAKPSPSQIELAHWFIDLDVDAVIGSHPHWMQSIESYRGRPIVYSLGNFIFDQDWSEETRFGLIAGLALSPDGSDLRLFPIRINESQPELLTGEDRRERLNRLSEISDPSLEQFIKQGMIPFKP